MKPQTLLAFFLASAAPAFAAVGVVESTGQFLVNSSVVYLSPTPGGTANPTLDGYDFGSFNPLSDTLELTNWFVENYAYNAGPGSDNWITDSNSATLFLSVGLSANDQILGHAGASGNNHFWNNTGNGPVNLLDGLSNGTYSLSVSLAYTYNDWDGSSTSVLTSSGNSLATASFTVVPEPAAALLGSIGLLILLGRRR
ncbi:hypothetical protein [Luteolibacter marinus]|uniref:hypothetical protein n=1 Tax=Luteolibacter marinus TaxID=2776705 RepID=UPI0018667090|nr:hypothetical protein [Luteolibacter marinus]